MHPFSQRHPIQLDLDVALRHLHRLGRLLPAITPQNGPSERARLVAALERGDAADARFEVAPRRVPPRVWDQLDSARALAERWELEAGRRLYLAKLEELELDLLMLEALGNPRKVRPLAARRFGTGRAEVQLGTEKVRVADVALRLLESVSGPQEPLTVPADAAGDDPSVASMMRRLARAVGLSLEVRIEPRLAAGAATGERQVLLADRAFGRVEALRLTVHEVLGHAVAAANGRAQPLRLFEFGTAGSFADQEGLALHLEAEAGTLDGYRLRVLAARVWVADRMHAGASFPDTARALVTDLGFSPRDSVALCERSWRGGGVARDAGYLRGYLRVRSAIAEGVATVDTLRSGRVGLDDVAAFDALAVVGLYRLPLYRPSLARSLSATDAGTSLSTSPPSLAASLTMFEET